MTASVTVTETGAAVRMNEIYRHQRHIYDLTRKYYLFGRDRLIDQLKPGATDNVLEIGCGTGRNLIRAARIYSNARLFGIDVSTEMLVSAKMMVARADLSPRIVLAQADALGFNPIVVFGENAFARVFISYSLSMIPEWRRVLNGAFAVLAENGEVHIIDFGDQAALPAWLRAGLRGWLAHFDVIPCDDLEAELKILAMRENAILEFARPYRSYAQYAVVRRALR